MTGTEDRFPQLGRASAERAALGSKAATLDALAAAGFNVPPGFVVTSTVAAQLGPKISSAVEDAAVLIGPGPFAVRSSAAAEDLPGASYAGLYETFLNVQTGDLGSAIAQCLAAADAERVSAYQSARGTDQTHQASPAMAVLVQQMIQSHAAGVAFTTNPITGDREETIITAVKGLGESLVSGEAIGEQWTFRNQEAICDRSDGALTPQQAREIASMALRVAERAGMPQDIEWAIDSAGTLFLLQARPMTALPEPVEWSAPGPGVWARNFRLGEWLPDPMTPLFEEWLLPRIEAGYLDGMEEDVHIRMPFRYASVNGWYYIAPPIPSPRVVVPKIVSSRGRLPWFLFNALLQVSRNPAAAHRAVLHGLELKWRNELLPEYRKIVTAAEQEVNSASPEELVELVDTICHVAGRYLWSLSVVGGSAWKMEAALARFWQKHLAGPLAGTPAGMAGHQALLRGLTGTSPVPAPHAVYSVDWYHPTAGETGERDPNTPTATDLHNARALDLPAPRIHAQRISAESAARHALMDIPGALTRFDSLLTMAQYYAVLREEQSLHFTLGWPVLRKCAQRLGERVTEAGAIDDPADIHFLTLAEAVTQAPSTAPSRDYRPAVTSRRTTWNRQRLLDAPLLLGDPGRFGADPVASAVEAARTSLERPKDAIVGHPASTGRATGTVRVLTGPADFDSFLDGEVLVARSTAPAWTPLFARAAAVVTDGGTLAAHASLIAREFGIPAVVGTGDATRRLRTGQRVTVDGGAGFVVPTN
ncbi:PEP/pyruvate-binding domain-containing protein [Paenarthrobacter sp. NPDC092416]|uniref:PEP/pyruvate-binding domain-containing protein n=1 Tax=Paenarthrobacter sp. NPDC092416 TaxID=3364386 RepID=UPI0037FEFCD8